MSRPDSVDGFVLQIDDGNSTTVEMTADLPPAEGDDLTIPAFELPASRVTKARTVEEGSHYEQAHKGESGQVLARMHGFFLDKFAWQGMPSIETVKPAYLFEPLMFQSRLAHLQCLQPRMPVKEESREYPEDHLAIAATILLSSYCAIGDQPAFSRIPKLPNRDLDFAVRAVKGYIVGNAKGQGDYSRAAIITAVTMVYSSLVHGLTDGKLYTPREALAYMRERGEPLTRRLLGIVLANKKL